MEVYGWDIGLSLGVNFITTQKDNKKWKAKNLSELEKKWYKVDRKSKDVNDFNDALDNALVRIANEVKNNMIRYAPIDESKYRDDVVLKENIDFDTIWKGRIIVWSSDIPYAARRNYENNLHPDTRHYIEKSWNNHMYDYQEILDEEVKNAADDLLENMIKWMRKSSWAWMPHRYF